MGHGKKAPNCVHQEMPMDVYSVRLPAWHARKGRAIGNGSLSDGIRVAIENAIKEFEDFDTVVKKMPK